jgi:hypothetical protein
VLKKTMIFNVKKGLLFIAFFRNSRIVVSGEIIFPSTEDRAVAAMQIVEESPGTTGQDTS